MAKLNFYLRDKNVETATPLILFIRYNKNLLKYSTGETIEPKFWNDKKQEVRQSLNGYSEFNTRLKDLANIAENEFRTYLNDNDQTPPTVEKYRELLNSQFQRTPKEEQEKPLNLFSFCEQYLKDCETRLNEKTGKPMSKTTLRVYRQAFRELQSFKKKYFKNREFNFEQIDYYFYTKFQQFLVVERKFSTNTVGKHTKTLKSFFLEAQARGLMPNFYSKRFKSVSEQSEAIYLNENEIGQIYHLDLANNSRLEKVRDLFVIGCLTGLRFSDFTRIRPENIDGEFIEIQTQKTGEIVVIPIHPIVNEILNKYENKLPKAISNQKMNDYLKEIGELAELDEQISKSYTKGGQRLTKNYLKYELITTHSARRSFATNAYKMGLSTIDIMGITGHRTEKAFMRYIKITPREKAQRLREMWSKQTYNLKIA